MKNEDLLKKLTLAKKQSASSFLQAMRNLKYLSSDQLSAFILFELKLMNKLESTLEAHRMKTEKEWKDLQKPRNPKKIRPNMTDRMLEKFWAGLVIANETHDKIIYLQAINEKLAHLIDKSTLKGIPRKIEALIDEKSRDNTDINMWLGGFFEQLAACDSMLLPVYSQNE